MLIFDSKSILDLLYRLKYDLFGYYLYVFMRNLMYFLLDMLSWNVFMLMFYLYMLCLVICRMGLLVR